MNTNAPAVDTSDIYFSVAGLIFLIFLGFWGKKTLKIAIFFTAMAGCAWVAMEFIDPNTEPFTKKSLYFAAFVISLGLGYLLVKFLDISVYLATGAVGFMAFHFVINIEFVKTLTLKHNLQDQAKYIPFAGFFVGALLFWIFKKRIFIALTALGSGLMFNVCANNVISKAWPDKGYEKEFYVYPGLGILATISFFLYQHAQLRKERQAKNKNRV